MTVLFTVEETPTRADSAHSTPRTRDSAHSVPRVRDSTPRSRVQRRNERGETPLHMASIKGDGQTAVSLIEQGASVNATDHAGGLNCVRVCVWGGGGYYV